MNFHMPQTRNRPINIVQAYEMDTSELHLNQHHVGSHRADHGPKHAPGVISKEGCSESRTAQKEAVIKSATIRSDTHIEKHLTETSPLSKSGAYLGHGRE
jgi:hypothetical protein